MKLSDYNFIYEGVLTDNKQTIVYNARSCALVILGEEEYSKLIEVTKKGICASDTELINSFIHCGFIVNDDVDELNQIRLDMLSSRYHSSSMTLAIVPTMDCNFRCIYCFEKEHRNEHVMSSETINKISDFVQEKVEHLKRLTIIWYGGEPLLAIDKIEDISLKLMKICDEHGVEYSASITTNGFFLTEDIAKRLKQCKVNSAQIIIDGPKHIHDTRRFLESGSGTFDTILSGIIASKSIITISVRINTDRENYHSLSEVMDIFKVSGLLNYVNVTPGLVTPTNNQYEQNKCLHVEDFSKLYVKFIKENGELLKDSLPKPLSHYCMADQINGWLIDSRGEMYKCFKDAGIESCRISSLHESAVINQDLMETYMFYDPTEDDECKTCKCLPICMGGCPNNRLQNINRCCVFKYSLKDIIVSYANTFLQDKAM